MRILALADDADSRLWGEHCRERLAGVDLILSAGDLPSAYLSYLTCFSSAPVVYVHGNHDQKYEVKPPEGCLCADDRIVTVKGVRILGLGGSMRYRPGEWMFDEDEMENRIWKLRGTLRSHRGFDILLTHAPAAGIGDQQDLAHRGFECFKPLMDKYEATVMVHGHVHQSYSASFVRTRQYGDIPVINACGFYYFDLPETRNKKEPSRLAKARDRKTARRAGMDDQF